MFTQGKDVVRNAELLGVFVMEISFILPSNRELIHGGSIKKLCHLVHMAISIIDNSETV